MVTYSLEFSERLIECAQSVIDLGENSDDAGRTMLYLSLLSCEITLKALLEKAGMPTEEIRRLSHNLNELLLKVGECEVEKTIKNKPVWVPATEIRGKTVIPNTMLTVGVLLEGETGGASKYPNDIRYGGTIYHFPPGAVLKGAKLLLDWAKENREKIRHKM